MQLRSHISILLIVFCSASAFFSCSKHLSEGRGAEGLNYDTTTTAIIPFNPEYNYPFDSTAYKPATLTQEDLKEIDSLFIECLDNYNNVLVDDEYKFWRINLNERHYRKQLIAVINKNGEKEVWVNCFCSVKDKWKKEVVEVSDGGTCYFSFKINLATKQYYQFGVHGVA